jgi:hypothetical protein
LAPAAAANRHVLRKVFGTMLLQFYFSTGPLPQQALQPEHHFVLFLLMQFYP